MPGQGDPIRFVRARPFPRPASVLAVAAFGLALALGVARSLLILLRFRPHLIIGTGGYVSAPVLFAYGLLNRVGLSRSKVFVYEPNAHPGMLNQQVGSLAHRIGVAFEPAARWFDMKRVAVVGYPVRQQLCTLDRAEARRALHIAPDRVVVLAFGGSGGARVINQAVVEALPHLRQRPEILVLHITGRYAGPDYNAIDDTKARLAALGIEGDTSSWYRRMDYSEEIQQVYAVADLVICRGGAGTLTELCVCGLPALVVPRAEAADDHQALNARQLEDLGAAGVVYQEAYWDGGRVGSRVSGGRLASRILELTDDPERLLRMGRAARQAPLKNGLDKIVEEAEGLIEGRRPASLNLEFPPQPKGLPTDPNALLRHVETRIGDAGGIAGVDARDLAYLRYQADRLLTSEAWYEIPLGRRNVGIKLVGQLGYVEQLPLLLDILRDRALVNPWRRFFGGDYHHGGILRRNVVEQGICRLGVADEQVMQVLLDVLGSDPYFEVRAAAARALGELCAPDERLERALCAALADHASPVVVQALRALGHSARDPGVLEQLRRFYLHPDWQFRLEVVQALGVLLERQVLSSTEVAADLEQVLATSPFFEPEFPLKEALRELATRVRPPSSE